MKKASTSAFGVILILALTSTIAGCGSSDSDSTASSSPSAADTWRIGVEAPLSGSQAVLGEGMLQGAQLAADQINAAGGVLDRDIELIEIDDAADPDTGVAAAQEAIDAGLDAVVGPYNSGVGIKTLPLYLDAGVVPVRLTSDNATDGQGVTLQPMSSQIAPVTAKALQKLYKAESVGIIYDETQIYSRSTSKAVRDSLKKAGVKVTDYLPIQPGLDDYSEALAKVQAKKPDVIYPSVYFPEGAVIAQALADGGTPADGSFCLLDYSSYDTGYVDDAGTDVAQTCKVVGVPAPGDFKGAADYVSKFEDKFSGAPGTWSPYTYDSLNLLADSASKAGGWDSKKLTTALNGVSDWKGWTGSVTIDPKTGNRDPATVVVTTVDDAGEFHVDEQWAQAVSAPY